MPWFLPNFILCIWLINKRKLFSQGVFLFVFRFDKIRNSQYGRLLSLFNDIESNGIWKAWTGSDIKNLFIFRILIVNGESSRTSSINLFGLLRNVDQFWYTFVDGRFRFGGIFFWVFSGLERKIATNGLAPGTLWFDGWTCRYGGSLEFNNLNFLRFGGFILFFRIVAGEVFVMTFFGLGFLLKVFRVAAVVNLEELLVFGDRW